MSFESNESLAQELVITSDSDCAIYRSCKLPILKNLATKGARGTYDRDKALKAFGYLADASAKAYVKQFGSPGDSWFKMFPPIVRRLAAIAWRVEFECEYDLGNYDRLLPKKYQKRGK